MDGVRATSLPLIYSSAIKKQKVKPTNKQKNEALTFVLQSWQVTHLEGFTTIFFLAYSLVPFSSEVSQYLSPLRLLQQNTIDDVA